jgi:hypothetical protein
MMGSEQSLDQNLVLLLAAAQAKDPLQRRGAGKSSSPDPPTARLGPNVLNIGGAGGWHVQSFGRF